MKFSEISKKKTPPQEPSKQPPPPPNKPPKSEGNSPPPASVPKNVEPAENRVSFTKLKPSNTAPSPNTETPEPAGRRPGFGDMGPKEASSPLAQPSESGPLSDIKDQRQQAQEQYGRAIHEIRTIVHSTAPALSASETMRQVSQDLLNTLQSGNQSLLALATCSTPSNYLYSHLVNVAILSIHVGLGLRWNQDDLVLLGVTALLHDIGAAKQRNAPTTAEEQEKKEIQTHTPGGEKILEHLHEIQETEIEVLASLTGRSRESGTTESLSRSVQIIGISNVYEAMSHARPWRDPLIPHEVLRAFVRIQAPGFDQRLVKFFIERMSLFPPGSYVLLSTGEIGCVVGINPHLPTRPFLEIRVRPDGTRESPPTLTNLGDKPIVHVVRAIDETKLNVKDKRLLLQFQAGRWWTD